MSIDTAVRRATDRRGVVLVGVVAVLALVPLVASSASQKETVVQLLIFAIVGVGWNLMGGFAGQFSFGHALYYGCGAYTSAVLVIDHGLSPWVGMLGGAVVAGTMGVLAGYLTFRYRLEGAYYALSTFAFAEMARLVVVRADPLNAGVGYRLPFEDTGLANLQFAADSSAYYYVALGLLAAVLLLTIVLERSRLGYYWVAIREDEEAARAAGIDPVRFKLVAAGLSGAITGVAGAFFLQFYFFIDPDTAFGPNVSIQAILVCVVGGIGTVWGPLVGAVVLTVLVETTTSLTHDPPAFLSFFDGRAGLDIVVYGAALILMILFMPKGIVGTIAEKVRA